MMNHHKDVGDAYEDTLIVNHKLRCVFRIIDPEETGLVNKKLCTSMILKMFHECDVNVGEIITLCPILYDTELIDFEKFRDSTLKIGRWCVFKELLDHNQLHLLEHRWTSLSDPDSHFTYDFPPKEIEKELDEAYECEVPVLNHYYLSKFKLLESQLQLRCVEKLIEMDISNGEATFGVTGKHPSINMKHTNTSTQYVPYIQVKKLIAGGVAGSLAKTVIAPMDRTKIIFQTSTKPYSLRAAMFEMRRIYTEQGFRALWRGNSATLSRVFPYAGIQFLSFDFYKARLLHDGEQHLRPMERILAGSLAGATSVFFTYPLDVLRARMAIQHIDAGGLRHNFRTVYHSSGVQGLYRGFVPTVVGILPYAGLSFGAFETLKILMMDYHGTTNVTAGQKFLCGALAGYTAQSLTYPLDIVRRRIQTDSVFRTNLPPKYTGIIQTMKLVANSEGIRGGLFKGVTMNWIKGPIAQGISFTTFDILKELFHLETGAFSGQH